MIRGQAPTFHFEGGTVVRVHMVDMGQFIPSWMTPRYEEWVVTSVEVRYYETDPEDHYLRVNPEEKVEEVWDHTKLSQLKAARPWYHPWVEDPREIKGDVGVFFDGPAREGYLEVDPERNTWGHYTLVERVEYRRFVDGDLERAKAEAHEILKRLER